jgi:hypothetical protein
MPAMKDMVNGVPRYRHFINGQWTDSTVKEWIEVENPATGAVIARRRIGADDADRALVAAAAAQPAWEALPPVERDKLLIGLARLILENRDRLARLVVAEQGKPLTEARGEIEGTALYLTYAAEEARRITGDIIPSDNADEQVWIQRVAHGVVVALTAWNYPAALTTRKMGPALLAGNTIVIKSHRRDAAVRVRDRAALHPARLPAGRDQRGERHGRGVGRRAGQASDPAPHHADRQRASRQGDLPIRRRRPQDPASGARRQGALHRGGGCRYRRRGESGGRLAFRELRPDLPLRRDVRAERVAESSPRNSCAR